MGSSGAGRLLEVCDWCGAAAPVGSFAARVPDSSCVHRTYPELDGQRLVVACGAAHLRALQDYYAHRPFHLEELWAAQLARGLEQARAEGRLPTPDELARHSGLSRDQLRDALRWKRLRQHRPAVRESDQ